MKKPSSLYRCASCGHTEPKWLGRCPECGQWNTFAETTAAGLKEASGESYSMPIVSIDPAMGTRVATGSGEFDRVLGGGLMRGSAILLGGEPGIGKSTLLLQVSARLGSKGRSLYVSGEESPAQIRSRAERLGALKDTLEVFCSTELGKVMAVLDSVKPVLTVIDSIQTIYSPEAGVVPGTANQIKYCSQEMVNWAKSHDSTIIFVAHVTKDGLIAGPKAAEHIVDAVLNFEQAEGEIRILRATKNRFGSTEELGFFRMLDSGLTELADPSGITMIKRDGGIPAGVAISIIHEGSRILHVEIQALTVPAKAGITRVYSDRIDGARVARIAAVLEKQTGLRFSDQDIYVNVAGGLRIDEPAVDLGLAAALYSARTGQALPGRTALAGELSLAGEIRPVRHMVRRSRASRAMGFDSVLGPKEPSLTEKAENRDRSDRGDWTQIESLKSCIKTIWGSRAG